VSLVPMFGSTGFGLFVAGMLWLAMWHGRVRLWGLVPVAAALAMLAFVRAPDLLVTGDGRNLGLVDQDGARLLILREGKSSFTRDAMLAATGMSGTVQSIEEWPGARCNRDACLVELARGGRIWRLLVLLREPRFAPADLARACAGSDVVISSAKLFEPCRPTLAKVEKTLLLRTGGLAFDLVRREVRTVAESEGEHPWWRYPHRMARNVEDEPGDPAAAEANAAVGQ